MKNEFTIFFSWQNDIPGCKNFIIKSIKKAIKDIKKENDWKDINIIFDHDTSYRSGSPDIIKTVHQKINLSDVFIADITPITEILNKKGNKKLIPNPNVMSEQGFALRSIGEDRIILLYNEFNVDPVNFPFDISGRRLNPFSINKGLDLKGYILSALMKSKENIQSEYHNNLNEHDCRIFEEFKMLFKESELLDDMDHILNYQMISAYTYNYLDKITGFLNSPEKQFLNLEIKELGIILKEEIDKLTSITAQYFSPMSSRWEHNEFGTLDEEEVKRNSYYSWIDKGAGEYLEERIYHEKFNKIIHALSKQTPEVKKAYMNFRDAIKRLLYM